MNPYHVPQPDFLGRAGPGDNPRTGTAARLVHGSDGRATVPKNPELCYEITLDFPGKLRVLDYEPVAGNLGRGQTYHTR